jgi:hypothetical protein
VRLALAYNYVYGILVVRDPFVQGLVGRCADFDARQRSLVGLGCGDQLLGSAADAGDMFEDGLGAEVLLFTELLL